MTDTTTVRRRAPTGTHPAFRPTRLLYALGLWLGLAVVAILNATVRETLFAPAVGDYWGHVASTATLVVAIAVVASVYFRRVEHSFRELVAVGGVWLVATVVFEFGFGHYVMGNSWAALLADYDLFAGRVWVLVLATMALAPAVFGHYLRR